MFKAFFFLFEFFWNLLVRESRLIMVEKFGYFVSLGIGFLLILLFSSSKMFFFFGVHVM